MFNSPNMPGMPQMPFAPFPFAGTAAGGATPSDRSAEPTAGEQDGAPTTQGAAPVTQGVPFMPFPLVGLMQMQLSMQMQMIAYMQQVLSQMQQQQGGVAPSESGMQLPFNMPIADLQKLLQIDASPKALETLQRVLDFVFDAYTKQQ